MSDASPLAGLPDGEYEWEHEQVFIRDSSCRLADGWHHHRSTRAVVLFDGALQPALTIVTEEEVFRRIVSGPPGRDRTNSSPTSIILSHLTPDQVVQFQKDFLLT